MRVNTIAVNASKDILGSQTSTMEVKIIPSVVNARRRARTEITHDGRVPSERVRYRCEGIMERNTDATIDTEIRISSSEVADTSDEANSKRVLPLMLQSG